MSGHGLGGLEQTWWALPSPGPLCFLRNKTGILGWRSEKTEMVNGYEAKVSPQLPGARPCHTPAAGAGPGSPGDHSLSLGGAGAVQR